MILTDATLGVLVAAVAVAQDNFSFARDHCHPLAKNSLLINESLHWGLNPGPSVYKTDALPLSYRGHVTCAPGPT